LTQFIGEKTSFNSQQLQKHAEVIITIFHFYKAFLYWSDEGPLVEFFCLAKYCQKCIDSCIV